MFTSAVASAKVGFCPQILKLNGCWAAPLYVHFKVAFPPKKQGLSLPEPQVLGHNETFWAREVERTVQV